MFLIGLKSFNWKYFFLLLWIDVKANGYCTSHDMCFPLMKWITKTLHPSAPSLAPLANFTSCCGPSVKKFAHPSSRILLSMPAYMASKELLCTKVLCAYDTVPGSAVVLLLDPEGGHTKAVSVTSALHKEDRIALDRCNLSTNCCLPSSLLHPADHGWRGHHRREDGSSLGNLCQGLFPRSLPNRLRSWSTQWGFGFFLLSRSFWWPLTQRCWPSLEVVTRPWAITTCSPRCFHLKR